MEYVDIRYYVVFGKCDASEHIDWELALTDEEAEIYNNAVKNKISLESIPELNEALQRAYEEIEENEIELAIENEDEYVLDCQGARTVDPDELNELIAERDPHALAFFGLEDADEKTLDNWDANELEKLPLVRDFDEDFEPYSPFDEGWDLRVYFVDSNNEW